MHSWPVMTGCVATVLFSAALAAEECAPGDDVDIVIEACSSTIDADAALVARLAQRYEIRAGAYESIGEYNLAISDYEAAIRLAPAPHLRFKLGNTYLRLGDAATALAIYDQLLADGAVLLGLQNNRGNALEEIGRYDEAVASWLSSIEAGGEGALELWRDYLVQRGLLPEGVEAEVTAEFEEALLACAVSDEC